MHRDHFKMGSLYQSYTIMARLQWDISVQLYFCPFVNCNITRWGPLGPKFRDTLLEFMYRDHFKMGSLYKSYTIMANIPCIVVEQNLNNIVSFC